MDSCQGPMSVFPSMAFWETGKTEQIQWTADKIIRQLQSPLTFPDGEITLAGFSWDNEGRYEI